MVIFLSSMQLIMLWHSQCTQSTFRLRTMPKQRFNVADPIFKSETVAKSVGKKGRLALECKVCGAVVHLQHLHLLELRNAHSNVIEIMKLYDGDRLGPMMVRNMFPIAHHCHHFHARLH